MKRRLGLSAFPLVLLCATGCLPSTVTARTADREITAAETRILQDAENIAARDCMRDRGFTIYLASSPALEDKRFPYVLDDLDWARRHGYGTDLAALRTRERGTDPNQRYVAALPPARQAAYSLALNGRGPSDPSVLVKLPTGATMGESTRGCIAKGGERVYGDLAAWFAARAVTDALRPMWEAEVRGSATYSVAVTRWATCMRGRGYQYPSPDQAAETFLGPRGGAHQTEIRTAVAEVNCARGTGLIDLVRRLDDSRARAYRTRYAARFHTRHRLETAALPRARAIVESSRRGN
jgi:hypothetical protein